MERKFLQLTNFAKNGINSDLMPWDLPGDFLTELSNIRISRSKLSPFGGEVRWADLPVDFEPGLVMYVNSSQGTFWLIAGLDKVYVYDGSTFTNISSLAGYVSISEEDLWNGCMLSNIPIINNVNSFPEYWPQQNVSTKLIYLPWDATNTWADVNQSCRILRSHKQFLFAMDLSIDGLEVVDGVRWSAPADIAGVPNSWDEFDVTNVAGLTTLGGAGGRIIDGLSLRDAFVVYREGGVSVFDYIGGQFVWQIRNFTTTNGLISKNCIVEVKGKHLFIGNGDILVNDGNSIESLMQNRLRKRFLSDYDPDNASNSYAVKNDVAKEVWFCIPQTGRTYPSVAYIYNWEDDTWSIRDIPEGPSCGYGPQAVTQETWASVVDTYENTVSIWSKRTSSPLNDTVVAVIKQATPSGGESGRITVLDSNLAPVDAPYSSTIERLGFALEGLNNVTTITRIYPHIRGPGSVFIRLGSQDYPGASVRWKQPVLFDPNTDRKVDIRTTGELHCYRIYSIDSSIYWEFSGMDIEYVTAGER